MKFRDPTFMFRFIVHISCLISLICGAVCNSAAPNYQAPTEGSSTSGVWEEPIDFKQWLQYIHLTSDPAPGHGVDEARPNMDKETNSTQPNLLIARRIIVVDQSGKGDSVTVQEAIDLVPRGNRERVVIRIRPGIYREKVRVPKNKPYITLQGHGNKTVITFNSTASDPNPERKGAQLLTTFNCATVAVDADFFIAIDIVFENSAPAPRPSSMGKQAVAFRISGDMAAFYGCRFLGTQDTLYDHHGRHYFKGCYIQGTIDFVFGYGRSFYKNCVLKALDNFGEPGSLTAQKREITSLDTGFAFVDSHIMGSGQVYLGRAWGNYSRVVFARCYMADIVLPIGWNDWGIEGRRRTTYYAEFNCSGPGAATRGRAPWARVIDAEEARPFLSSDFVNGKKWLPRDYHDLMQHGAPTGSPMESKPLPDDSPAKLPSAGFVINRSGWSTIAMVAGLNIAILAL